MGGRLVSDRLGAADSTPHGLSNTHEIRCPCWGAVPGPVGNPGRPRGRPAPDVAAGTPVRAAAAAADDARAAARQPRRRAMRRERVPHRRHRLPSTDTTVTTGRRRRTAGQERARRRRRLRRHPANHGNRPASRRAAARSCARWNSASRPRATSPRSSSRRTCTTSRRAAAARRRTSGCPSRPTSRRTSSRTSSASGRPASSTTSRSRCSTRRTRTAWSASTSGSGSRSGSASRSSSTSAARRSRRPRSTRSCARSTTSIRLDSFIDPAQIRRVESVVREMLSEKGYLDGEVSHTVTPIAGRAQAGEPHVHDQGRPAGPHQGHRLHRQRGDRRRGAEAPHEGEQGADAHQPLPQQGRLPAGQVRGGRRERPRRSTARKATSPPASASPRSRRSRTPTDGKTRSVQLRIPVTEGPPLQGRQVRLRGQHGRQGRGAAADLQARDGRLLLREEDPQGPREGARAVRHGRLFRVHRLPRPEAAATWSTRAIPTSSCPRAPSRRGPPVVDVTMRMQEGEQYFINRITFKGNTTTRDNVIRRELQPARGRRVQHRGAEEQRPPPESARLLQAARGRAGRHRRQEDAGREEQGRRHAGAARSRTATS